MQFHPIFWDMLWPARGVQKNGSLAMKNGGANEEDFPAGLCTSILLNFFQSYCYDMCF